MLVKVCQFFYAKMCILFLLYNKNIVYLCRPIKKGGGNNVNWGELKKIAIEHGFKFYKHGGNHDFYKRGDQTILIERHQSQEVRKGMMYKLKKQIGF